MLNKTTPVKLSQAGKEKYPNIVDEGAYVSEISLDGKWVLVMIDGSLTPKIYDSKYWENL